MLTMRARLLQLVVIAALSLTATSRTAQPPERLWDTGTFSILGYDPQTAGGLLISLPRERGPALEAEFARAGLFLARVGTVETGTRGPALMASAALVLGWIGLWRRDGATLQPSAPRARRSLRPTRQRGE